MVRLSNKKYRVLGLDLHLQRLSRDSAALMPLQTAIPCDNKLHEALRDIAWKHSDNSGEFDIRVRITCWENFWECEDVIIPPHEPTVAGTSLFPFDGSRSIPEVKSCSALLSVISHEAARNAGYSSALFIDNGVIRETSWGNFCWITHDDKIIVAPRNVLPGTTQSLVITACGSSLANLPLVVEERESTAYEFASNAVEAFSCNAITGIVPIVRVGEIWCERSRSANREERLGDRLRKLLLCHDEFFQPPCEIIAI